MNFERLELMATLLDEVAAGTWECVLLPESVVEDLSASGYDVESNTEQPSFNLLDWLAPAYDIPYADCGYCACAVGHAMLDERFNKLGFGANRYGTPCMLGDDGDEEWPAGWPSVRRFFDISEDAAERLFSMYEYEDVGKTTPAQVAARIREFITKQE